MIDLLGAEILVGLGLALGHGRRAQRGRGALGDLELELVAVQVIAVGDRIGHLDAVGGGGAHEHLEGLVGRQKVAGGAGGAGRAGSAGGQQQGGKGSKEGFEHGSHPAYARAGLHIPVG